MRTLVCGVFLISILTTSFSSLGHLPATLLRPVGVMNFLPWSFFDALLTPIGTSGLKWGLVLFLLMAATGVFTSFSTKLAFVLVLFYQGLLRSFGHFNHDEMLGIYFLLVLAFAPCGEAFSFDNWRRPKETQAGMRYGFPVLMLMLLMAWVYFSSGVLKLRVSGLNYFHPDNLPALAIYHSLDNLHDTHFKLAFLLPQVRQYLPAAVGLVLAWELVFPLSVFWRRARWWILGFGVIFHLSTLLLMNIFFPHQLALYLVFIDWPRLIQRLRIYRENHKTQNSKTADL